MGFGSIQIMLKGNVSLCFAVGLVHTTSPYLNALKLFSGT